MSWCKSTIPSIIGLAGSWNVHCQGVAAPLVNFLLKRYNLSASAGSLIKFLNCHLGSESLEVFLQGFRRPGIFKENIKYNWIKNTIVAITDIPEPNEATIFQPA
jgi:hypothetical protein